MCQDCVVLHERLKGLSEELFHVKRACTRLKGELRHERKERAKLVKAKKEKKHYRNGQKRGRTRNG